MEIFLSNELGYCKGVSNAIDLAKKNAKDGIFCLGRLIHNERVIKELENFGIFSIKNLDEAKNKKLLIRAHGIPSQDLINAKDFCSEVIDATCPFVKESQRKVEEYYKKGYQIIILGDKNHPEIIGINSYCNNSAIIINSLDFDLPNLEKVCLISQTTFNEDLFENIVNKIKTFKINEFACFNTICYTTISRQNEANNLSKICDFMLVLGDKHSANTNKLFDICSKNAKTYLIEKADDVKNIKIYSKAKVGIVAGASTPMVLIKEVLQSMSESKKTNAKVVANNEFLKAVEAMKNDSLHNGKRVDCTIVAIDNEGLLVDIGQKREGLVPSNEVNLDGSFNANDFKVGDSFVAKVTSTQKGYRLSRKAILEAEKGNEEIQKLQENGNDFQIKIEKVVKGGLISHFNGYTVFVPASQIRLTYVKNLEQYAGKTLKVRVLEDGIDHSKRRILASQRVILEAEKKEKEEAFRNYITSNDIVEGKVVRFTEFGAFVNVMGVDCLAHISDLSWGTPKKPNEVLEQNKKYNFKVLKRDFENNRFSLGYKQLQPHPWELASEKYPVGTVITSKVVRVVPFGAFVEVEPGLDGLVHVSNISHNFLKDINKAIKVGDEISAKVLEVNAKEKRLTLSMKALIPEPPKPEKEEKPEQSQDQKQVCKQNSKKDDSSRRDKKEDEIDNTSYISSTSEVSIADMFEGLNFEEEEKENK